MRVEDPFQNMDTTLSFDFHLLSLSSQEAGPEGPCGAR